MTRLQSELFEYSATFSLDEFPASQALTGSGFDGIKIWDFLKGKQIQRVEKYRNIRFHQHLDNVGSIIFSPDGNNLLSSGSDGLIQVWDIETGQNIGTLQGQYPISSITMSKDAHKLVGFGGNSQNERTVEVWRVTW